MKKINFLLILMISSVIFSCGSMTRIAEDSTAFVLEPPKITLILSKTVSESSKIRDVDMATGKAANAMEADERDSALSIADETSNSYILEITPKTAEAEQKIFYSISPTCITPDTEYKGPVALDLKGLVTLNNKQEEMVLVRSIQKDPTSYNTEVDDPAGLRKDSKSAIAFCIKAIVVKDSFSSYEAVFEFRTEIDSAATQELEQANQAPQELLR